MIPNLEESHKVQISRLFQGCLLGFIIVGAMEYNAKIAINSFVGLLVTLLPETLERDYDIAMNPWLVLWIVSAILFHAVGTLGLYGNLWWWDHFTHTLSASLVAAAGYATLRALDQHTEDVHIPKKFTFIFILVFVMAFGVIWEVIEFFVTLGTMNLGMETVITQHGISDTLKDLLFNSLGAVIVAVFGSAYLSDTVDIIREKLEFRELQAASSGE